MNESFFHIQFIIFFKKLFFFKFLAALDLCCCMQAFTREWGLLSNCSVQASHCGGFSLQSMGSRACRLQ